MIQFGCTDLLSVINSFKEVKIKPEQHGSGEGEGVFQAWQTGLTPTISFLEAIAASNLKITPIFKYFLTCVLSASLLVNVIKYCILFIIIFQYLIIQML